MAPRGRRILIRSRPRARALRNPAVQIAAGAHICPVARADGQDVSGVEWTLRYTDEPSATGTAFAAPEGEELATGPRAVHP